ncbi:ABC transporter permease subunit [Halorarius litoreus]|uniref:ABC transporter permease subunit n=1 Tax=Halorarius litoreus TaxID=2962676 RepID=UPI0020CFB38F|nr:ABC transporter permease subunit [Halorarius litoreus]
MSQLDLDSVEAVAKKDFQDAIRSRALLVLTTVFVVFFAASAFFFADQVSQQLDAVANSSNASQAQAAQQIREGLTSDAFLDALTQVTRLLIPLTGIVVAYAALVGERESGTLKLLLALPHSRLDVVLGKVAGRSAVVAAPVLLGFLVAAPVFPILGVTFNAVNFALFALATAFIGVVFVALSVGVSAAAPTSRRAVITVVGLYALFTLLWGQFANAIVREVSNNTDLGNTALVKVFLVVKHLNPVATYQSLVASLGQGELAARVSLVGGLQGQFIAQQLGEVPIYLTDGALVVYLLLWIAVPVVLGYLTFQRADL